MIAVPRMFADRRAAGAALGRVLAKRKLQRPIVVLALPRGGVPVGYEVARALHAPLDVMVVRKIGMPGQPELAIGALATGGVLVRDPRLMPGALSYAELFEELVERERPELERRERLYRAEQPPLDLKQRTVVLVDDGLATGSTMLAAARAARKLGASTLVVAAPVASDEAAAIVGAEATDEVFLRIPAELSAIGEWYEEFDQVEDAEVQRLLRDARSAALDSVAG